MRQLLRLGLFSLAMVSAAWAALECWPISGFVSWVNCCRIQPGMSRAEVNELLGGPGWKPDCGVGIPEGEDPEFWHGWVRIVRVDFDANGRVIRARHRRVMYELLSRPEY